MATKKPYFNPDGDDVVNDSASKFIMVRFVNKEDMDEFEKQTGIKLNTGIKKYKFSSHSLDKFFL
jgi:hypothetical protein